MNLIKPEGGQPWGAALRVYRHPRVLAMLFLGFSSGLPFMLVAGTLTARLFVDGASMAEIGMFAWVGIMYSVKFVWAPVIDRMRVPLLSRWLGRRRSWMLLAQVGVGLALMGLAYSEPAVDLGGFAWLAVLVAFASATQDVVVDAYRIEAVELKVQGAMAASYQLGYRIALLVAGAGALYIAQFASWQMAYQAMALLMSVGIMTALLINEPESSGGSISNGGAPLSPSQPLSAWFADAVIGPFVEFFSRNGRWALVLLAFIGVYRISDMVLGVMANPFYIDIGFSLAEIATVTKVFGFAVTIAGAAIGGVAVARYGVGSPLVFGAVLLAVTNLFFAGLAAYGKAVWLLFVTIGADNLAAGFTGTVFIAYLSGLTNVAYTATQYALFSSVMTLPGKIIAGFSGQVVQAVDWFSFFLYASAMGLPAILLALIVTRHDDLSSR